MLQKGTFYSYANDRDSVEYRKPLANIYLYFSQDNDRKLSIRTDQNGEFEFELPLGAYQVTMSSGANSPVYQLAGGSPFILNTGSTIDSFEKWVLAPMHMKPEDNPLIARLQELADSINVSASDAIAEIEDASANLKVDLFGVTEEAKLDITKTGEEVSAGIIVNVERAESAAERAESSEKIAKASADRAQELADSIGAQTDTSIERIIAERDSSIQLILDEKGNAESSIESISKDSIFELNNTIEQAQSDLKTEREAVDKSIENATKAKLDLGESAEKIVSESKSAIIISQEQAQEIIEQSVTKAQADIDSSVGEANRAKESLESTTTQSIQEVKQEIETARDDAKDDIKEARDRSIADIENAGGVEILQDLGESETATVSQKVITNEFITVREEMKNLDIDLSGYATEGYVNEKFESIEIPEVDLSQYRKLDDNKFSGGSIDLNDINRPGISRFNLWNDKGRMYCNLDESGSASIRKTDEKNYITARLTIDGKIGTALVDRDISHDLGQSKVRVMSEYGVAKALNELGADYDLSRASKDKVVSQFAFTEALEQLPPPIQNEDMIVKKDGKIISVPIPATGTVGIGDVSEVIYWGKAPYNSELFLSSFHNIDGSAASERLLYKIPGEPPYWCGNVRGLFFNNFLFNDENISKWTDTSHFVNVSNMFALTSSFNQVLNLDVSNVTSASGFLISASEFDQDISHLCFASINEKPADFDNGVYGKNYKPPKFGSECAKARVFTMNENITETVDDLTKSEINQRDAKYLRFCIEDAISNGSKINEEQLERLRTIYIEEEEQENLLKLNIDVNTHKAKQIEKDIKVLERIFDRDEEEEQELSDLMRQSSQIAREVRRDQKELAELIQERESEALKAE